MTSCRSFRLQKIYDIEQNLVAPSPWTWNERPNTSAIRLRMGTWPVQIFDWYCSLNQGIKKVMGLFDFEPPPRKVLTLAVNAFLNRILFANGLRQSLETLMSEIETDERWFTSSISFNNLVLCTDAKDWSLLFLGDEAGVTLSVPSISTEPGGIPSLRHASGIVTDNFDLFIWVSFSIKEFRIWMSFWLIGFINTRIQVIWKNRITHTHLCTSWGM